MGKVVTTGPDPMTVGSSKVFQLRPVLDGLPWSLAGGSANLILSDPAGGITTLMGTVTQFGATASWTVAPTPGRWSRTWQATDASGTVEYSVPIPFDVITAP